MGRDTFVDLFSPDWRYPLVKDLLLALVVFVSEILPQLLKLSGFHVVSSAVSDHCGQNIQDVLNFFEGGLRRKAVDQAHSHLIGNIGV